MTTIKRTDEFTPQICVDTFQVSVWFFVTVIGAGLGTVSTGDIITNAEAGYSWCNPWRPGRGHESNAPDMHATLF
jgi:hypothetical protein